MSDERPAGFEDLYAYIDSQFLDSPEDEKAVPAQARAPGSRVLPPRARTPLGPVNLPPMGQTRSSLRTPPPPVPPDPKTDTAPASVVHTPPVPVSRVAQLLAEATAVVEVQEPEPEREAVAIDDTPPFIDAKEIIRPRKSAPGGAFQMRIPKIEDYLPDLKDCSDKPPRSAVVRMATATREAPMYRAPKPPRKLKRPELSGPRPRQRRSADQAPFDIGALPDDLRPLAVMASDDFVSKYYRRPKNESLQEAVNRITNPELTLEETAKFLGVCPATVRRYTNKGWLRHHRTKGNQRRFRLSDITDFLKEFGRKKRD